MLRAALLGCLLAAATAPAPTIARAGNATRARRRLSVDYQEVAKLTASDAAAGDQFGVSVALDGNTVIIGASGDGTGGAVYVFRTSDGGATYVEVAKLTAADAATLDYFGWYVAIDGNTIVVAAHSDDGGGSAYVFRTTDGGATYDQVAKLTAADGAASDYFGESVAIDGATIVIGAHIDGTGGSAYVFRTSDGGATYSQVAKLTASDAAADDRFGYDVAIDGGTVVVGAHSDDGGGSAYVFRTTDGGATYDQVAKLVAADAAAADLFGWSVVIDGDTVVVSAFEDDDGGSGSGSAYVFHTTDGGATYGQVAKLTASDAASSDYFGSSVAIDGDTVVIGATAAGTGGAVYVLRTSDGGATYDQVAKLTAADGAASDYFGESVAIAGGTVVVGSRYDDDAGSNSGSVYAFLEAPTGPTPRPTPAPTTSRPTHAPTAVCTEVVDIEGTMHTCDEASANWGLDCVWLEVARGLDCRGCDCAVDGVQSGNMWSMEIYDATCTTARSVWGAGDVLVAEDIGGAIFEDSQPAIFANDVCSDLFDWNGRQVSVRGRCSNGEVWAQWFDGAGCDADAFYDAEANDRHWLGAMPWNDGECVVVELRRPSTPTLSEAVKFACVATPAPTVSPTPSPSKPPTSLPTFTPTYSPRPTVPPTSSPSSPPSSQPSPRPTRVPTAAPSAAPTPYPTTSLPSFLPTSRPTAVPSRLPTAVPTAPPTPAPSGLPTTAAPTGLPTTPPPTPPPSSVPSRVPSSPPSAVPTTPPSSVPSVPPSRAPSPGPTVTFMPSILPTPLPSPSPTTAAPTMLPTPLPSPAPTTASPTPAPSPLPSPAPSISPGPTPEPSTAAPSRFPSAAPSASPTAPRPRREEVRAAAWRPPLWSFIVLAVLVGAALMGPGAWFALKKYEARLTDRIRSDVESKMLSPPERPPRATPRRDYDEDTVRNLPLPLAPTAPMRPPGFDAYSRATRSAGPYVYSRAPPATPHSSRSRRSPLVAPYTPQSRRSAKVAPTPTSPLEAELSELRSRLEAVEAPIVAEVAELRARLDFVERASPHHSPDAADRVHRADASPYSSASRTRASGVNADHAGERAWPMIPRRLEDALDAVAGPAPAKRKPTRPAPEYHPRDRPAPDPLSAPPGSRDSYGHGRHPSRRRSMNDEASAPSTPPAGDDMRVEEM